VKGRGTRSTWARARSTTTRDERAVTRDALANVERPADMRGPEGQRGVSSREVLYVDQTSQLG